MPQTLESTWNSFVGSLLDPSGPDQIGADLEAAKWYVESWVATNIKPVVDGSTSEARALADQSTELSS